MSGFTPLWAFTIIGGPILFIIVMLVMKARNQRSRAEKQRTEQATRENYQAQDRADKAADREGS